MKVPFFHLDPASTTFLGPGTGADPALAPPAAPVLDPSHRGAALSACHQALHDSALAAARDYEHAEARLIETLIAVDQERVFARLGFPSLFVYATDALKLSRGVANQSITVARRAARIPELRSEIQLGSIGVSTVKKMASVIRPENQAEWLSKAKSMTTRQLEKAVAKANPQAATPEKAKYVSEHRLSVSLGMSEEAMIKVRRAQDQHSRSLGRAASLEETFQAAIGCYLHHHDPLEKARRAIAKKGFKSVQPKTADGPVVPAESQAADGPVVRAEAPAMPAGPTDSRPNSSPGPRPIPNSSPGPRPIPNSSPGPRPIPNSSPIPVAPAPVRIPPRKVSRRSEHARPRKSRPAQNKHTVNLRDRRSCRFPKPGGGYCGSSRWIEHHHVIPVSQGGSDEVSNLLSLCSVHHKLVHHGDLSWDGKD